MAMTTRWVDYQVPYELDNRADFATFSNEDIGWVATLATGVNDTYEYAQPFPSSYSLFDDAMVWYRTDHMFGVEEYDVADNETVRILEIYTSFLQVEFAATFQGLYADVTDEIMKTKLHGPLPGVGQVMVALSEAAITVAPPVNLETAGIQMVHEYAINRQGYDIFMPYYVTLVNKSHTFETDTGIFATADHNAFESFMQRIWHRKRLLTTDEKNFRMVSARFMHIDT